MSYMSNYRAIYMTNMTCMTYMTYLIIPSMTNLTIE